MITLRRYITEDWQALKDIRLEALQNEPHFFGGRYHEEAARADQHWIDMLAQDDYWAFWGLYDGDTCIGLTGAARLRADPTCALLIASYIRTEYRNKGLSALYYKARIDWARSLGYKTVEVHHRSDNHISKAANQKFGFVYTHTDNVLWPDGTHDDRLCYRLIL
ncbi:MAG: GNAT family N-acetyltransferase [Bacteroidetes bacterium]|nr:GNAT family N-acetyltransferase [Bacteroidota bacterium]